MASLATACAHLTTLRIDANDDLTSESLAIVLSGVLQLPQLTTLTVPVRLSDVERVLPELVAAGRQLKCLYLETSSELNYADDVTSQRSILRTLARMPNVPFVVHELPDDIDAFVVDALSPHADHDQLCDLAMF
ncbi:hypothetical protein SDRG_09713 [Saprolegnia diclina VS20]|uniref:Uncharacterized protein n=1 Tax=Saprolegnia diclina (strain VS20) TaxID=1156394 RepID=T0QDB9_SAPDV|nr:hypothetical protein SDRG_09713 [Saprolegnia diclina VS20]EQC32741.1 hypothetical protein SDRG_09713 [Saprolegnia diclina VS20]|eukprot:XP_008613885.1 hypothetical protein SDRG_09713 [Saprolegnia diclina VS20]